jgi:hypothetical protein
MKWLLAEDLVSREELPRKVFYHGLPASPGPSAAGQAIRTQEALIAGRRRKLNPLVLGFAENFLDITGLEDDFILIHEAYNAFKDATGSNTTRNVFVRQLKDIDSRIVNKQKKINGVPLPAFFGVKFREKFQS